MKTTSVSVYITFVFTMQITKTGGTKWQLKTVFLPAQKYEGYVFLAIVILVHLQCVQELDRNGESKKLSICRKHGLKNAGFWVIINLNSAVTVILLVRGRAAIFIVSWTLADWSLGLVFYQKEKNCKRFLVYDKGSENTVSMHLQDKRDPSKPFSLASFKAHKERQELTVSWVVQ